MHDIVIASAARTPIGRLGGALASLPAHRLGQAAIAEALRRAGVAPEEVSEVILGQVLTAGAGQNPARQAAVAAGIPFAATAMGVSQVCGSGLRAVALGFQALRLEEAEIVVAGGQESMSFAPHCAPLRAGVKLGDVPFVDTMIRDGLWDAFHHYHMGQTAENIAQQWKIGREEQDTFALASQRKATAAQAEGRFAAEITPVTVPGRKGETVVTQDEEIRPETTPEALTKLRPAFLKEGGTVTAGNASSLNDGAAALVLMRGDLAARRGISPLARIVSWATAGVDPAIMGIGPVEAVRRALARAGWKLDEVDLIEANEAFAVQSCAVGRELGWDPARVNVNGGAIALGHPIGASGARVLVTLLHEMERRNARRGLATLCIGGGMGIALCVERP
ncbi:acetyl-CoA acetyltransferase [Verrucomicrobium sp. GAS474]|uniref:acetyl-CoA C-acetyltransferase n=1 Tax=Verrucomicrobium sp. GAS474 TaxID=1882831 RepID=UPI0008793159|nr:acetyl-CoA C-acetyltransferase [Verrucomicrobium sp. GAS474]SDU29552.1 acetyl-CoA acetyltransferase [Verrucomicrobium sp. GAS474]